MLSAIMNKLDTISNYYETSLKDEYQHLLSLSKEEVTKDSPFIGQTDISGTLLSHLMRGKMQQADTQKVDSLLTILKKKDYLPGRLPSVSKENPGFSNAPLPSEVISIKEYMNGMSTFISILLNSVYDEK